MFALAVGGGVNNVDILYCRSACAVTLTRNSSFHHNACFHDLQPQVVHWIWWYWFTSIWNGCGTHSVV